MNNPAHAEPSVVDLIERVGESARDLAIDEARLLIDELDGDLRSLRRTAVFFVAGGVLASLALAWGGVALASAVGAITVVTASLGAAALVSAIALLLYVRVTVPKLLLKDFRARLAQRIARVKETIR